ncbi:hypothetical protein A3K93_09850 [Acinetobacter sp. NCu2D-2]|uniref:hypothetical protein n=1 Tax=Acinetobacter sp. NCu2D-2 TaxID=1608473 RepID=UPI0007CDB03E|nr:hypothetical protein [Acinetobacter sp. NCu2D-2]ANF82465.1 hypothetical protein A3K93_09850 [Acinetobacter sp. NCu2D-2]
MALDQIWKQQLTLVTYGNEFLNQDLSFSRWVQHSIFNQHAFAFRDLISQHLLAQHFQVWLEGLKKQGVKRLSLHRSTLLIDEQNPNPNVELLALDHFIVSHESHKKHAWIIGKELAEWYNADNDYEAPDAQRSKIRFETMWRYELSPKFAKRIDADLEQPKWKDIQVFTNHELFESKFAQDFQDPTQIGQPYYGLKSALDVGISTKLALIPTDYQADYAHETLYRFDALYDFIQAQIQHPYNNEGETLTPEQQLDLRHFAEKIEDLHSKFVVKVANHYKTAHIQPQMVSDPLAGVSTENRHGFSKPERPNLAQSSGASSVIKLILITIVICVIGYYFGL